VKSTPRKIQSRRRDVNLPRNSAPGASIGRLQALGEVRQRGGKRVIAFAGEGHFDPAALASNTFDIEWPPRSGRRQNFPEVDRAEWFDIEFARTKILSGQMELLDRLLAIAGESAGK
jgi:predicted NUDIX family NTP pyrophosphohydrolase